MDAQVICAICNKTDSSTNMKYCSNCKQWIHHDCAGVDVSTSFSRVLDSLEPGGHYLTIVFTDMKGFTSRVEKVTKERGLHAAIGVKEELDSLLRKYLDENSYIKSIGDGCLFLFKDVCKPIKQAIKLQIELNNRNKNHPIGEKFELRIGIHSGYVIFSKGTALTKWKNDPLGHAVNLASRVMCTAPAGTIHLTDEIYSRCNVAELDIPSGVKLSDIGFRNLKGVETPCHLWQINPSGRRIEPILPDESELSKSGKKFSMITKIGIPVAASVLGYLAGKKGSATIFPYRSAIPWIDLFSKAKNRIYIIATNLAFWQSLPDINKALNDALNNGCEIELFSLDPNSKFVEIRAKEIGSSSEHFKNEISSAQEFFKSRDKRIKTDVYNRMLNCMVSIIDSSIYTSFLLGGIRGRDCPHIELKDSSTEAEVFLKYFQEIANRNKK